MISNYNIIVKCQSCIATDLSTKYMTNCLSYRSSFYCCIYYMYHLSDHDNVKLDILKLLVENCARILGSSTCSEEVGDS